jgi:hypothetical protein
MKLFSGFILVVTGFMSSGCTVGPAIYDILKADIELHGFKIDLIYYRIENGNFKGAIEDLKDLESKVPPTPALKAEIAYLWALLAEYQGQTEEAVTKYRAVIADFPDTPDAYMSARKLRRLALSTKSLPE